MSIHGITAEEYVQFLEQGGKKTITIEEEDLKLSKERLDSLGDSLYSGFQDPPPPALVNDLSTRTKFFLFGEQLYSSTLIKRHA